MNTMIKRGAMLAATTLALLATTGCGPTKNYVDHITWLDQDTFYISYVEKKPMKQGVAKMRRCVINDSNETVCEQEPDAETILNKKPGE